MRVVPFSVHVHASLRCLHPQLPNYIRIRNEGVVVSGQVVYELLYWALKTHVPDGVLSEFQLVIGGKVALRTESGQFYQNVERAVTTGCRWEVQATSMHPSTPRRAEVKTRVSTPSAPTKATPTTARCEHLHGTVLDFGMP
jgi:hypothetical protein